MDAENKNILDALQIVSAKNPFEHSAAHNFAQFEAWGYLISDEILTQRQLAAPRRMVKMSGVSFPLPQTIKETILEMTVEERRELRDRVLAKMK